MRFYNVTVVTENNPFNVEELNHDKERDLKKRFNKETTDMMELTYDNEGAIFFVETKPLVLSTCIINEYTSVNVFTKRLLDRLEITYKSLKIKEVSMDVFFNDLKNADRSGLVEDDWAIAASLDLEGLFNNRRDHIYSDRIADENKTVVKLKQDARDNYLGASYTEELNRILKGKILKKFMGHPAHYIILSNNGDHRRMMIRDLITALYKKGRLPSKRYTLVSLGDRDNNTDFLEKIYSINYGATILLIIENEDVENDGFKKSTLDIDRVCEIVKANCSKVLTIFSIDSCSLKIKDKILNALMGVSMVDISEDTYYKTTAVSLVKAFAKRDEIELSEDFIYNIKNSDRNYDFNTLINMYTKWRHEYLGTTVFPEYKKYVTHELEEKDEVKGDAYKELQEMIGLSNAKKVIDDAINFFKLQKEYRLRGIEFKRPCMHMVFTGNPGTAKTSVARLVARILKDNGILSVGNLYEVGRADIIGQFVGQTAPLVKSAFNKAKGSVLFIDEAYSLVDDRKGLYGDEAINTIVQEMENHREDMIVIFAGYKDEMQEFLERNPGLNSRIAFHVPFDDYSENELLDITKLIAKQTGFRLESEAENKLINIYSEARKDRTFGNGRFARNLVEKAKFHQSNRLVKEDLRFVSDETITTLKADDFELPEKKSENKIKLGFGS